jgi:type I restriction enzyme R subunit
VRDEELGTQAGANTYDNFKYPFEDAYKDKVIDRMDQNQEIFNRLMEEGDFSTLVFNTIMKEMYKRFNKQKFTPK